VSGGQPHRLSAHEQPLDIHAVPARRQDDLSRRPGPRISGSQLEAGEPEHAGGQERGEVRLEWTDPRLGREPRPAELVGLGERGVDVVGVPTLEQPERAPAVADPRSYDRYNSIADAVSSVDAGGAAKLYATLKPRIEEAYKDRGTPDSFDHTLERAIVSLLSTPAVDATERLKQKGIGYGYADERLESLTAAQKQLLRMGPRNVRVIKAKLRDIAIALGIPPAHLPAA